MDVKVEDLRRSILNAVKETADSKFNGSVYIVVPQWVFEFWIELLMDFDFPLVAEWLVKWTAIQADSDGKNYAILNKATVVELSQ